MWKYNLPVCDLLSMTVTLGEFVLFVVEDFNEGFSTNYAIQSHTQCVMKPSLGTRSAIICFFRIS